ncbi:hypothetical protein ETU10_06720 [Apibacter muscae]|uniref:hypothetical protein n=1 Tax=Apibacter muscae TaxID=2509004 RepID=UPI0011AC898C|nr:hypothetical protein [Apibacter muscae]TWP23416.1 hypothetical protein ETU10_06720 [Apibacter muscae]
MEKMNLFLFIVFINISVDAQVGINQDSPTSTLDIVVNPNNEYALKVYNSKKDLVFNINRDGNIGFDVENSNVLLGLNPDDGAIGIGNSYLTASEAGSGAIKYSKTDQLLYYSDGLTWSSISSKVLPLYTVANLENSNILFPTDVKTQVTGFTIIYENNNAFIDGIFTAPRDGSYIFSYNLGFNLTSVLAGSYIEMELSILPLSNDAGVPRMLFLKSRKTYYVTANNMEPFAVITSTATLKAGEKVIPYVYHNLGSTISLNPSACSISIVEN